jgi:hypothetical protein
VKQPALLALMALRRSPVDVTAAPEPPKRTAWDYDRNWWMVPFTKRPWSDVASSPRLNLLEEQIVEECATLYDQAPQIALPLYRLRYRSIASDTGEIPFSGRSSSGGFGLGRLKMLDLSMGIDWLTPSPPPGVFRLFPASPKWIGSLRVLERLERNDGVALGTIALFIRFWLTSTPALPEHSSPAARAKGAERYDRFVEALGRRLSSGSTILKEVSIETNDAGNAARIKGDPDRSWSTRHSLLSLSQDTSVIFVALDPVPELAFCGSRQICATNSSYRQRTRPRSVPWWTEHQNTQFYGEVDMQAISGEKR